MTTTTTWCGACCRTDADPEVFCVHCGTYLCEDCAADECCGHTPAQTPGPDEETTP